jgi:hypothetical protein
MILRQFQQRNREPRPVIVGGLVAAALVGVASSLGTHPGDVGRALALGLRNPLLLGVVVLLPWRLRHGPIRRRGHGAGPSPLDLRVVRTALAVLDAIVGVDTLVLALGSIDGDQRVVAASQAVAAAMWLFGAALWWRSRPTAPKRPALAP